MITFLLGFGWILFFALYVIGLAYFVVEDVSAWRKQGIPFQWGMVFAREKFTWPLAMLSDTIDRLRK